MKSKFFIVTVIGFVFILVGFRFANTFKNIQPNKISRAEAYKYKQAMQCSPDWSKIDVDSLAREIGELPGWGNYRWKINTTSDSAQFYFNQGINMYYAFHIIESMSSFKKAEQFDSTNAMIYWAQALAYGPNINDYEYANTPDAYQAAQKAVLYSKSCTPREMELINAMSVRYSSDSTESRKLLNRAYANAMKKSYLLFYNDQDMGALYADALMLQHPWNYWKHNGDAQVWTPEILSVLENVLSKNPDHPGANHYYIHSVEASHQPQKALPSADRLGILMPGVSHMIHMPSHIYIRTGNYLEGMKVNEAAVNGYTNYLGLFPEVQNNAPLYKIHNLHMQSACAFMKSNFEYSNKSAAACINSIDTALLGMKAPIGNGVQYLFMTKAFGYVRYGKWDSILQMPPINTTYNNATVLNHWARGMALAGKNQLPEAVIELAAMHIKMKAPDLKITVAPFNAPIAAARIAENILEAVIAEKQNNLPKAIKLFKKAVKKEDALNYSEPADWLLPTRQYLGKALLRNGDAEKAVLIFQEDLFNNPKNHWSLSGLYQAYVMLKKEDEAAAIKKQYETAFAGNDISKGHIVF